MLHEASEDMMVSKVGDGISNLNVYSYVPSQMSALDDHIYVLLLV